MQRSLATVFDLCQAISACHPIKYSTFAQHHTLFSSSVTAICATSALIGFAYRIKRQMTLYFLLILRHSGFQQNDEPLLWYCRFTQKV
jgi:hypothetical protein